MQSRVAAAGLLGEIVEQARAHAQQLGAEYPPFAGLMQGGLHAGGPLDPAIYMTPLLNARQAGSPAGTNE